MKFAERAVVRGHLALALQDVNLDRRLIVRRSRKRLRLARRDRRVPLDQRGHDAAQGLDAQRQRSHVEQQDVFHLAAQHAALNCRAHRNHFVRVDALVRLLASEEILHDRMNARHTRRSADQHNFIDLTGVNPGIRQGLLGTARSCAG